VGSGPFKFDTLKKVRESDELSLIPNDGYYGQRPYLKKVILKTYGDESKLVAGYNKKEILGMEKLPGQELSKKSLPNMNAYQMSVPEYDVIYFNTRTGLTKDKAIREAISLAIDRNALIDNVYSGEGFPIYGPLLPGFLGFDSKLKQAVNVEAAKAKLAGSGFVPSDDGIYKSGETRASVRLLYPDSPEKNLEAEIIRDFLKTAGIEARLEKYPIGALVQDHIRPRDFDLLLVAQNLGADSDLYPLWHSTGVNDPGLNFSGLSSRLLDKNLEQGRTSLDQNVRAEKYSAAAKLITDETPAVFLVWPNYIYGVSRDVKGIQNERLVDPNDRFWNITSWYIDEKQAYR
jgi:peptide/nickel transport system substrate-binding protein